MKTDREQAYRFTQRAQALHPLDLVARIDYLYGLLDRCDADDLAAVWYAIDVLRNHSSHPFLRPRRET